VRKAGIVVSGIGKKVDGVVVVVMGGGCDGHDLSWNPCVPHRNEPVGVQDAPPNGSYAGAETDQPQRGQQVEFCS
jgi:hypothetical protein